MGGTGSASRPDNTVESLELLTAAIVGRLADLSQHLHVLVGTVEVDVLVQLGPPVRGKHLPDMLTRRRRQAHQSLLCRLLLGRFLGTAQTDDTLGPRPLLGVQRLLIPL